MSSPEYPDRKTIQLVYIPPCCESPGGQYHAYKDGKVVQVTCERVDQNDIYEEDDDEDDNSVVTRLSLLLWMHSISHLMRSDTIRSHYIEVFPDILVIYLDLPVIIMHVS